MPTFIDDRASETFASILTAASCIYKCVKIITLERFESFCKAAFKTLCPDLIACKVILVSSKVFRYGVSIALSSWKMLSKINTIPAILQPSGTRGAGSIKFVCRGRSRVSYFLRHYHEESPITGYNTHLTFMGIRVHGESRGWGHPVTVFASPASHWASSNSMEMFWGLQYTL